MEFPKVSQDEEMKQNEQSDSENYPKQQQQQNFTYYYSSFDLFQQAHEFTFIKYRKFIKKLYRYLGGDWQVYANTAVYTTVADVKQYLLYDELFEIGLQSWLDIRDSFTRQRKSSFEEGMNEEEEIMYFEENAIYEQFLEQYKSNLKNYEFDPVIFKPVAQGFFMSAVEIWNDTIKSIKNQRVLSHNSLYELGLQKEREQQELLEKKQKKLGGGTNNDNQENEQSLVGNLLTNVSQYAQSNVIIKPLMVATETIFGYFGQGQKKVKEEDGQQNNKNRSQQEDMKNPNDLSSLSKSNLSKFQNQLISEEQVVMNKIKQLSIQEKTLNRKRRNIELLENDESDEENNVQLDKIPKKTEKKLDQQVFDFASSYVQNLKKNTQEKWQVARGFVTNMIELNNSIISKTQKISNDYTSSIKIKFLQPAQQFYNQLMETWILFRQSTQGTHDFKKYLDKVKISMGSKWNETYVLPTQVFFKTLVYTWEKLAQEQDENNDEETFLKTFIEKVRENMLRNWESDIVNKVKLFKNKNQSSQSSQQHSQQPSMSDLQETSSQQQDIKIEQEVIEQNQQQQQQQQEQQ